MVALKQRARVSHAQEGSRLPSGTASSAMPSWLAAVPRGGDRRAKRSFALQAAIGGDGADPQATRAGQAAQRTPKAAC